LVGGGVVDSSLLSVVNEERHNGDVLLMLVQAARRDVETDMHQ